MNQSDACFLLYTFWPSLRVLQVLTSFNIKKNQVRLQMPLWLGVNNT